ncbi:hypothetical protein GRI39_01915 [Altererythrobacter indicus]|uniref:Holin n=1 Tax=Altericroceibacterium indicum TaxID=374177 RepID=A0A845A3H7_9SPHN|nr:hypothetical protein [Altericroceibacterium indicum]MXP24802.1 hypothetical protein [Altericroceibacterium indicum]
MDQHNFDPAWLVHAKLAGASLCGGMVRLLLRPASSFLKSLWLLFACVTCGFYGTFPAMAWLGVDVEYVGAVGALLGLLGISFAEGMLKAVDSFNFRAWLERLLAK